MNSFIVHPQNIAQENALKAFFDALNITFEKISDQDKKEVVLPHVVEEVRKSEEQIKKREFSTHHEMKKFQKYADEGIFVLPPSVIQAVQKSEEQIKNGEFFTYTEIKQMLKKQ